jgi:Zn-dependent M28 family amino/carboxypeptidase
MPQQTVFIRSDQYPFVRQGIPAAYAFMGFETSDPSVDGEAIFWNWLKTRYHTPKDDMNQDLHFESGARYARVNFLAGYLVAQDPDRPAWNEGDFFGDKFGPQEKTASR